MRRAQTELQDDRSFGEAPESAAGVRTVSLPAELLDTVTHHLQHVKITRSTAGNSPALSSPLRRRPPPP
ncbi:hypothetical protein GCM10018987_24110 [Streptomyces cremeus]